MVLHEKKSIHVSADMHAKIVQYAASRGINAYRALDQILVEYFERAENSAQEAQEPAFSDVNPAPGPQFTLGGLPSAAPAPTSHAAPSGETLAGLVKKEIEALENARKMAAYKKAIVRYKAENEQLSEQLAQLQGQVEADERIARYLTLAKDVVGEEVLQDLVETIKERGLKGLINGAKPMAGVAPNDPFGELIAKIPAEKRPALQNLLMAMGQNPGLVDMIHQAIFRPETQTTIPPDQNHEAA